MDDTGGQLAARYGVRAVPTFVLLDEDGSQVLSHSGMPRRDDILQAVEELAGS